MYNFLYVATPQKADFLFIYSTSDDCVAFGHEKKGFIAKLVETLKTRFNDTHLEDLLLDVKRDIAAEKYKDKDGKYYKQMPCVVSRMRSRVWFIK